MHQIALFGIICNFPIKSHVRLLVVFCQFISLSVGLVGLLVLKRQVCNHQGSCSNGRRLLAGYTSMLL